jgi:hypothetical protein
MKLFMHIRNVKDAAKYINEQISINLFISGDEFNDPGWLSR